MSVSLRLLVAAVVAVSGTLVAVAGPAPDAQAATRAMPGNFTGYAIDTCDAPSQRAMNAWRRGSKYAGIGIYVAGMNRACSGQPNLTRRWVRAQASRGWRLLPLVVGRQASCSPPGYYRGKRISAGPARDYARARAQGAKAARSGAKAVRRLGIGRGSVVWFDLEHFDLSNRRCRASAMAFTSAWTRQLHRQKFRSGLYSSAASGIRMVDAERASAARKRAVPDYIWVAEWNLDDTLRSAYISKRGWWPNRRVHQYRGGHIERHGGVALAVDSNVLRTGRGTRPGKPGPSCGVRLSFGDYDRAQRGDRGRKVRAAQCLLKQRKDFGGKPSGRFGKGTARAVRRFQRDADLRAHRRPDPRHLDGTPGARRVGRQAAGQGGQRRQRRTTRAARTQRRHRGQPEGRRRLRGPRHGGGEAVPTPHRPTPHRCRGRPHVAGAASRRHRRALVTRRAPGRRPPGAAVVAADTVRLRRGVPAAAACAAKRVGETRRVALQRADGPGTLPAFMGHV